MNVNRILLSLKLGFLMVFAIFFANCSSLEEDYNVPTSNVGDPVLQRYLTSKEGTEALRVHGLQLAMLDRQQITTDTFALKDVIAYNVPFVENGKTAMIMTVFVKHGGAKVHSLFADQRGVISSGGDIVITDEQGTFISELKLSKEGKKPGKMSMRISKVREDIKLHAKKVRFRGEGYSHCVARVYSTAKRACENSDQCRILCDFGDSFGNGECTKAMMIAAGVSCI